MSQGVSFSGITLAIVSPEDDPVSQQLEQVLSGMQDISGYCQVEAMEYHEAVKSLEHGETTAVLVLPENFVQGVMNGSNPDVELIVHGDRPLEAFLTFWVGQSASDLLTAVQSGIYTVLELYAENPPSGLSYQEVLMRINLRYISWTMNRQGMYRLQQIPITDHLPVGLHYSLSLFAYLTLTLAPMFAGVYDRKWIVSQTRFRAVGVGFGSFYGAALTACWIIESLLIIVFQLLVLRGSIVTTMLSGILCGLFCAAFGSFCCLLTVDTGSCGAMSFFTTLVFLALSGGILPPVLMPGFLQSWIKFSPVTWLRNMLAAAGGYEPQPAMVFALALSALVIIGLGAMLYKHRGSREVASP